MPDITTMLLVELKALAYDTISEIERYKMNLQTINREIAKRIAEEESKEQALSEIQQQFE